MTVTILKFAAYLYTGSASMLSEAIHSLADAANQVWKTIVSCCLHIMLLMLFFLLEN